MMNPLGLLIRLSRQTVEERQTDLETVGRVRADAACALAEHEQRLQSEFTAVIADLHSLADFSTWSSHAARHGAALKTRHDELGRVEAAARTALHTAFADSKRLELAQDATERLARKEAARKTDLRSDEQQILRRSMAK